MQICVFSLYAVTFTGVEPGNRFTVPNIFFIKPFDQKPGTGIFFVIKKETGRRSVKLAIRF